MITETNFSDNMISKSCNSQVVPKTIYFTYLNIVVSWVKGQVSTDHGAANLNAG